MFELRQSGNLDIYRVAVDGTGFTRLTSHASADWQPSINGNRVVFVSERDGNAELYALDLTSGAETRLTNTTVAEGGPTLSSDGSRLAFTREVAGVPRLFVSSTAGENGEALTSGIGFAGSIEGDPSWHPNGSRIAYMSTHIGNADIFDISLTGTLTPLAVHAAVDVEPAWSHDGNRVAFVSTRNSSGGDTQIFLLEFAAQTVTQLTSSGSNAQPAWLPDGRIVYTSFAGSTARLRLLDPARPNESTEIPLPAGDAGNAAAVR